MNAQSQGQNEQSGTNMLWVIAGLFLLAGALWLVFEKQIKTVFLYLRIAELFLIYHVMRLFTPSDKLAEYLAFARSLEPVQLNGEIMGALSDLVGSYMVYPSCIILGLMGVFTLFGNSKSRFKHRYNMRTLLKSEQSVWPQIQPVAHTDLVDEDIDVGPWAMAMTPVQFCRRYKLANVVLQPPNEAFITSEPRYKAFLIKDRAERLFSLQLGRSWYNFENMPVHRRALFAVFIGRGCRETQKAQALVAQLASSAAKGRLDCRGVDEMCRKLIDHPDVQALCHQHAYELTLLASCLEFARMDGVVAAAEFIWLKPIDRVCWYMINTVGRQTAVSEVAGVYAHWQVEKLLKRGLSVPMVTEATKALEGALEDMIYVPDDKEREAAHQAAAQTG